jgi:hypothetical protein
VNICPNIVGQKELADYFGQKELNNIFREATPGVSLRVVFSVCKRFVIPPII